MAAASGREESSSCGSLETHQTHSRLHATGPPRQTVPRVRTHARVCLGEGLRAVNPLACPQVSASRSSVCGSARRCVFSSSSRSLDLPPRWSCLFILFVFAAGRSLTRSLSPAPALTLSAYRAGTHVLPIPPIDSSTFSLASPSSASLLLCAFTPLSSDVVAFDVAPGVAQVFARL